MLEKIEIIKRVEKKIKNNDYKGALGDITKCLELYPNFIVAKVLKAECLLNLDNPEEALALANEVLFSAPDNIKARKIAIESNLKLGNIDEAKSHVDFLGFLLPSDHPYLEEIKKRLLEAEDMHKLEEGSEEMEIERTVIGESEQKDGNQIVEQEKSESGKEPVEERTEVVSDKDFTQQAEMPGAASLTGLKDDNAQNGLNYSEDKKDEDDEAEEIGEEEIVTGVLQEQISTVTLPEKREEPEIKTRTLALIYERQGMFKEALEILENLFEESKDVELLKDIERVKLKLKGGEKSNYIVAKIKKLEDWLERVKWHSSN